MLKCGSEGADWVEDGVDILTTFSWSWKYGRKIDQIDD